jgi:predicted transcriptional regulator
MATRLEQFLKSRRIKPAHLARESGYSRQHLLRVRMGRMEPTRRCIAAIVAACRRMSGEPVLASDLFELGEDERRDS